MNAYHQELLAGIESARNHCMRTLPGDHGAMVVMRLEQVAELLVDMSLRIPGTPQSQPIQEGETK